jgi:hypothetical protein
MSGRDRKRDYSQAFQLSLSATPSYQYQVPKTTAIPSWTGFSTPAWLNGHNKENTAPFDQGKGSRFATSDANQLPNFDFHYPPGMTPLPLGHTIKPLLRGYPLQTLPQVSLNTNRAMEPSSAPSNGDQFRGNLTLDSHSPIDGEILGFMDFEHGAPIKVYEDNFTLSGTPLASDSPTPGALNMQDLSLTDASIPRQLADLPVRRNRTSVHVAPSSHWARCFSLATADSDTKLTSPQHIHTNPTQRHDNHLRPRQTSRQSQQASSLHSIPLLHHHAQRPRPRKSLLHSTHLNTPSNFPIQPHTQIRILRLRADFPYAIRAMIEYIDTGDYTPSPFMYTHYPTVTMLDLHIHAYVVGAKYDIPLLCELAIKHYIHLSDMCLQMNFDATVTHNSDKDVMALDPRRPGSASGPVIFKSFLDSLALLWRWTPDRFDALRAAVLELIKHYLTRLLRIPFFATLMRELERFGPDVVESLGEDGLEVKTYFQGEGQRGGVAFA